MSLYFIQNINFQVVKFKADILRSKVYAAYSVAKSTDAVDRMKKLATDVFKMKYVNKKCTIDHLQLVAPFDLKYESFNDKK